MIDRVDHVPVQRRSSVTAVQSQSPESVVEPSVPPKRMVGRPRKDRYIIPNQTAIHRYFRRENEVNDNDGIEDEESPAEIELPGIPEVREVGPSQSVGRRKRMNLEGVVERLHTENCKEEEDNSKEDKFSE